MVIFLLIFIFKCQLLIPWTVKEADGGRRRVGKASSLAARCSPASSCVKLTMNFGVLSAFHLQNKAVSNSTVEPEWLIYLNIFTPSEDNILCGTLQHANDKPRDGVAELVLVLENIEGHGENTLQEETCTMTEEAPPSPPYPPRQLNDLLTQHIICFGLNQPHVCR
ncbi:hypothetical protein ZIOFF_066320 [Zingiber officinale]|uniref:Uncharacterized protein n=1 Tax=Zingiber officinale TaxID=94328 RepID=A0A8J5F368_ZINOF|nr:hypothetical protein ZIOFF_066320 [Zingiber officinale]